MSYLREDEDQSIINITSLIDVEFLLIMFFVLTTTFKSDLYKVDLELPKSSSGASQAENTTNPIVAITKSNTIYFNGNLIQLSDLPVKLKPYLANERTVLIKADAETKHRDIIAVIDIIQNTGFNNFAFVTEHENSYQNTNSSINNTHSDSKQK